VFGRAITPTLFAGDAYEHGTATFDFAAADPAQPISRPSNFQTSQAPISDGKPLYGFPLVLHKGDGAARLTATWQAQTDDFTLPFPYTCERSTSTIVEGTSHGQQPHFKLKRIGSQLIFVDKSCRHENLALLGRVTITVTGEGKTRSSHLNDQCQSDWHPARADAGHWELRQDGNFISFFAHRGLGLGEHFFKATIRFRKHVLAAYTIGVKIALG
jgi:hypothetical protein